MILKDASAFNIAFSGGRPIFLDHGSFVQYHPGEPWAAYRQFVAHFLGPLLLLKYGDARAEELLRDRLEGAEPDYVSRRLPLRSMFSLTALLHIYLHARFQRRCEAADAVAAPVGTRPFMAESRLRALLVELQAATAKLLPGDTRTEWGEYYSDTNYTPVAAEAKMNAVREFCSRLRPARVIDFGANDGRFSRAAVAAGAKFAVAADFDSVAVGRMYAEVRKNGEAVLPVLQDLNNPSPALGVLNCERESFLARAKGDLALGLALIHHLRVSGNWTADQIVRLFAETAPNALVEFVPKSDSQYRRLLRSRPDICSDWTEERMFAAFREAYPSARRIALPESERVLFELSGR